MNYKHYVKISIIGVLGVLNLLSSKFVASSSILHDDAKVNSLQKVIHKKRNHEASANAVRIPGIAIEKVEIACDSDGYPTIEALKQLLIGQFINKKIGQQLVLKIVGGGYWTERMYCASLANKPDSAVFFLKISANSQSAQKLNFIQQSYLSRLGSDARYADTHLPIPQKNLPIITMVEKLFIFKNPQGITKQIEVTHAAHGMMIRDVLRNHPDLINSCGRAMGLALGSFQQAFMQYVDLAVPETWTTACHNDLHLLNVLFDPKMSRIYFIDNESMNVGCSIEKDIYHVLFFFLMFKEFTTNNDSVKWERYISYSTSFIKSYIESFSLSKRVALVKYLSGKIDKMARDEFWKQGISTASYQRFYNAMDVVFRQISEETLNKQIEVVKKQEEQKKKKEAGQSSKQVIILIPYGQNLTSLSIKADQAGAKVYSLEYFDQLQNTIYSLPYSSEIVGRVKYYSETDKGHVRFVVRPAYTYSPIPVSSTGRYIVEYSLSNQKLIQLTMTLESSLIIKKTL